MPNTLRFNPVKPDELNIPPPAYIRLPKSGTLCPYTGLTRTALDLLTRPQALNKFRPPVRSKIFKQTGEKAGRRLIDYRSLRNYLESLPDDGVKRRLTKKGGADPDV